MTLGTCIHPRDNMGARWWLRGSISKNIAEEIISLLKEMTQVCASINVFFAMRNNLGAPVSSSIHLLGLNSKLIAEQLLNFRFVPF